MAEMPVETYRLEKLGFQKVCIFKENKSCQYNKI
jgi:hypothetical protein